jgi:lipopolysaccharide/colanic/teichoic acid biosynthesis glycosyltransferase
VIKRAADITLACGGLLAVWPLLLIGAIGIRLSSKGPILYVARRVGRGGRSFNMFKLRTMYVDWCSRGSAIAAADDPRVFAFGAWLRRTRIDELPQLFNVLRGDMSIVGPRPEDPGIVERYYAPSHRETLEVKPGLTSPGTLYGCTEGETRLQPENPEFYYVQEVLPRKLALDLLYVRRASFRYDLRIIGQTIRVLLARLARRRVFIDVSELEATARTETRVH